MKLAKKLTITTVATAIVATGIPFLASSSKAVDISEEPVPKDQVIAVAVPAGSIGYNLAVIEQIAGKQQCWNESGSEPTIVDPLWTTFDFTGSCRRSTDSNGYSVRIDGQDTSLDYLLSLVPKGDTLQLVAQNRNDRSRTVVGTTFGTSAGNYLRVYLNPGWQFTKKTVDGKVQGHFFFSGDTQAIAAAGDAPPTPPPAPVAASFSDTARDIYKTEIEEAVALGFIGGFKDKTFRPAESLTREQLVSMVYGALESIDSLQVDAPTQVPTQPYPDVMSSRWSAAKIQWAKENDIVKGYKDGTFKPDRPVTRAELVTVLQKASAFAKAKQGMQPQLEAKSQVTNFSDISGHWGQQTIEQMSAFCKVASASNEVGKAFNPDTASGRNYAAAATLRMHNCLTDNSNHANKK